MTTAHSCPRCGLLLVADETTPHKCPHDHQRRLDAVESRLGRLEAKADATADIYQHIRVNAEDIATITRILDKITRTTP